MVVIMIVFFFFNDTATTEIYTLSLHDALPISGLRQLGERGAAVIGVRDTPDVTLRLELVDDAAHPCPAEHGRVAELRHPHPRSEEHTSELQSANIPYAVFCL